MRRKLLKFHIQPCIRERLNKHQYRRWYVRGQDTLFAMQTAKPSAIDEYFYFQDVQSPDYRTQTAYTEQETMFLRKKPLVSCRKQHPGWGVEILRIEVNLRAEVA